MKVANSAALAALCLLLACSGRDTPDADRDDDTPGGGLVEESDVDTAPDTDADSGADTTPCNPWYPCQDCGGRACSSELSACVASGTCTSALNTWAACVLGCGDTEACAASFVSSGGAAAAPLVDCVRASCAEDCDL